MAKDKTRTVTCYQDKDNGLPLVAVKPQRNSKCICGSGKKAKNCCGVETKYYTTKK